MIRYLDNQEKNRTKDLWREAFPEDSEDFLDYYDQEKMSRNQVLVREEDGVIQSMLHRNPYRLQVRNVCWNVDYIVAVATRADMRHRGYMRSLLIRMMTDMRAQQMPFCFLMPAAEAIYTPFQFAFIYDQPVWKLKEDIKLKYISIEETVSAGNMKEMCAEEKTVQQIQQVQSVQMAADWMQRWLEQRYEVFTKRDTDYVTSLVREVKSELGSLEFLYDRERLVGIRGIWGREEKEQRLLYTEDGYSELEKEKPAIMARIITPETFVPVIHLKENAEAEQLIVCLELEDPLIPQNDGRFVWTLDHAGSQLEKLTGQIGTMEEALAQTEWKNDRVLHLRVEELTQWLFGYRMPEAVKQYAGAEQIDVLSRIFLDEVV